MTEYDGTGLPPDLPRLELTVGEVSEHDWSRIVRRARARRRRMVTATALAVVAVAGVPAVALLPPADRPRPMAHAPAGGFNDVCDVAYDQPATPGDRIVY